MLVGAYARCVWLALPASAVYLFRESREREAESTWRTQTEECVGSPEERRIELDNRTGDCARASRWRANTVHMNRNAVLEYDLVHCRSICALTRMSHCVMRCGSVDFVLNSRATL